MLLLHMQVTPCIKLKFHTQGGVFSCSLWLSNISDLMSRASIFLWSLPLQHFDFTIVHKSGMHNEVPNRLPISCDSPTDFLPDYDVIGSLDLHTLPPMLLADNACDNYSWMTQSQSSFSEILRWTYRFTQTKTIPHSMLFITVCFTTDPKTRCGLHPLKELRL